MAIKRMHVESRDQDSKLYMDCMNEIEQINEDINGLAAAHLDSDFFLEQTMHFMF